MALATGSLLAGRYEITAHIATGGMGEVWRARDRVLDRTVAAKVLRAEYTGDPSFLARFRNEARHTAALTHQNIASVYDYGETLDETGTRQLAFLVMEFVDGHPLVTILHQEGRLPVDWTLHVLQQSAEGLSAAHRGGVVHRDIKPGNLMVRPDGVVKLTDFGIAQARDATPLTKTGMVVGTAQYLSPEQAQGMEVTAASDVYSLGVVAYECLAGVRPFDGTSQVAIALAHINRPPPPLPGDIPPAVRLLVERALAKNPADRFPDGAAFAEAIRRVANGGALSATPTLTTPTPVVGAADGRTEVFATPTGAAAAAPGAAAGAATPGTEADRPMPPLRAPSDDEDAVADRGPVTGPGTGAGDVRRARRAHGAPSRRPPWIWAAVVLLVLLLGGGAWLAFGGDADERSGTTPASDPTGTATSAPADGVALDAAAYVGEPVDAVETALTDLGLTVSREAAGEDQLVGAGEPLEAGDVAALSPGSGTVPPGTEVVLYVAEEAYPPEEAPEAPAPAPEATSEAPAPPTAEPSTSAAAPTTSAPQGPTATATRTSAAQTSSTPTTDQAPGSPANTPPSTTAGQAPGSAAPEEAGGQAARSPAG
ncbi:protein kinase [Geodermatophilus sp. YIM 151500]|uniref:serine/threonine-protein kinase n=1 Tax=Geodermatophilus sp. YIM 151500 TaxID=2984531 RepID=UPI0021E4CEC2|nr:serine/threonine-protein kinase [Geodermatophilus sp. YIM 151500]MCV2491235.1 protein kinase [Geodermatophilus sp. YIM 151500]